MELIKIPIYLTHISLGIAQVFLGNNLHCMFVEGMENDKIVYDIFKASI